MHNNNCSNTNANNQLNGAIKPCLVTKSTAQLQGTRRSSGTAVSNDESDENSQRTRHGNSPPLMRSGNQIRMQSILKHSRARSFDSALTSSIIGLDTVNLPAFIYTTITSTKTDVAVAYDTSSNASSSVTLVVDDSKFVVQPEIFSAHPDTMLGRMFSPAWSNNLQQFDQNNDRKDVEIQISGNISAAVFRVILDFYRSKRGQICCPPDISASDLREAFDYFLIPFNAETVKLQDLGGLLHELSNVGARKRFETFLESEIMPVMVSCAQKGDRECHIVILCDDDEVEWDEEYPPQMGDQYSGELRNSNIHRFFKYVENRDVAKDVLRDRGFKKIKLGIEGYPTHVEKIKRRGFGRAEVIYNYIQRSFVRMSWEKEEAKSRHVDFQCVRSKATGSSISEATTDVMANVRLDPPPQVLIDHHQQRIASLGCSAAVNSDEPPSSINNTLLSAVDVVMYHNQQHHQSETSARTTSLAPQQIGPTATVSGSTNSSDNGNSSSVEFLDS